VRKVKNINEALILLRELTVKNNISSLDVKNVNIRLAALVKDQGRDDIKIENMNQALDKLNELIKRSPSEK
jgi:hypothetical protein